MLTPLKGAVLIGVLAARDELVIGEHEVVAAGLTAEDDHQRSSD